MLSAKEKRFLRYWGDQRSGGMVKYVLPYSIAWALILFLLPLAVSVFLNVLNFFHFDMLPVWVAIVFAMFIGFAIAFYSWTKNEKKWRVLETRSKEQSAG